jgi:uncharacterized protein
MESKLNTPWFNSFQNKHLDLILFITEQCNFRCAYCYENFKIGKMTVEIIDSIKKVISKRVPGLEMLNVSFFGGEPLLNKSAVLELSSWAVKFCKMNNVNYAGHITTNGYLLDEKTFDDLIQSRVTAFQITLDGEKQTHDKFRPTSNHKPTFDTIYSNISAMAKTKHAFTCTIRFNIADANHESIKSFIANYSLPFANDKRFAFHFHPIFGKPEIKLIKNDQLKELKELANQKAFKYNLPSDYALCYASRANSFSIRADGRVQKCTVALENEKNNIGKIDEAGNLNINEEKFKKWIFADNKGCPLQSQSSEKSDVFIQ